MTFLMMIDSKDKSTEIKEKLRNLNYPYNELRKKNVVIIPIINNDYSIVKKASLKSLLLRNEDFFKIIGSNEYTIRKIGFIEDIDEETLQEIDELLDGKKYIELIDYINNNDLHIKKLDIFDKENRIIVIYDSGIIFTKGDLHDRGLIKSIQDIISKILTNNCD